MPPAVRWLVVLVGALLPRVARALPDEGIRTASLNWVRRPGTEACASPAVVARAVEQRLGHPVFVPPARADLAVEAYVEHTDQGWHVVISLSGTEQTVGRRDLLDDQPSCEHVTENAVLAIALMIDPDAMLVPEPAAAAPVALPAPEPRRDGPSADATEPSRPSWRGAAEVAGALATGLLPQLGPGIFVRGRASPPASHLAVELEGGYFFQQGQSLQSPREARFAILFAGASLCWLPVLATRVEALVCGGADLGTIAASTVGFPMPEPRQTLLFNLNVKARLSFRLAERWHLLIGADAFFPMRRDDFSFTEGIPVNRRTIFRLPLVAGAFELGVAFEF